MADSPTRLVRNQGTSLAPILSITSIATNFHAGYLAYSGTVSRHWTPSANRQRTKSSYGVSNGLTPLAGVPLLVSATVDPGAVALVC